MGRSRLSRALPDYERLPIMGSIITTKTKDRARNATRLGVLAAVNLSFLRLRAFCFPVLNCHSCPLSVFACPIGVLVNFSMLRIVPFITIGILGLVGVVSGRLVCGWVCPFGLLQDGLHRIPTKKMGLWPRLGHVRYVMLVGLVLAVPLFFPKIPYTFCHLCPAGTLESAIPWTVMGAASAWRFGFLLRVGILVGVVVLSIGVSKGFCRVLCPLGLMFSAFNKFSLLRMRRTTHGCNGCGECARRCPVGIDPVRQMNSGECVRCLECTMTGHLALGIK